MAHVDIRALLRDIGIDFTKEELPCWDPNSWYPVTNEFRILCGLLSLRVYEALKKRPEKNTLKFIIGTGNGATMAHQMSRSLSRHMGLDIEALSVALGKEILVRDPKNPAKTWRRARRFLVEGRDRVPEIKDHSVIIVGDVAISNHMAIDIAKSVEVKRVGGRVAAFAFFVRRDRDFSDAFVSWMRRPPAKIERDPPVVVELVTPNHTVDTASPIRVNSDEEEALDLVHYATLVPQAPQIPEGT